MSCGNKLTAYYLIASRTALVSRLQVRPRPTSGLCTASLKQTRCVTMNHTMQYCVRQSLKGAALVLQVSLGVMQI